MAIEAGQLHNLVRTYRRALRESGGSGQGAVREPNSTCEDRASLSGKSSRHEEAAEAASVPAGARSGGKMRVSS